MRCVNARRTVDLFTSVLKVVANGEGLPHDTRQCYYIKDKIKQI